MKMTSKQQREVHNHMKRHGVTYDQAKRAVVGGYGDSAAEREAMYAERRASMRMQDNVDMATATALLFGARRRAIATESATTAAGAE